MVANLVSLTHNKLAQCQIAYLASYNPIKLTRHTFAPGRPLTPVHRCAAEAGPGDGSQRSPVRLRAAWALPGGTQERRPPRRGRLRTMLTGAGYRPGHGVRTRPATVGRVAACRSANSSRSARRKRTVRPILTTASSPLATSSWSVRTERAIAAEASRIVRSTGGPPPAWERSGARPPPPPSDERGEV